MRRRGFIFSFCLLIVSIFFISETHSEIAVSHVRAELVSEVSSIQSGQPFWVALRLVHEKDWHTYYKDPGDSGLPTTIKWQLPNGFVAGEIGWPKPLRIEAPPLVDFGYTGEVLLLTQITPPITLKNGTEVVLRAKAEWLMCKEACIPGAADLELKLPVIASAPAWNSQWKAKFDTTRKNIQTNFFKTPAFVPSTPQIHFALAILFAFFGGLILNLMPCVFPILSIKVLGFVQQSGQKARELRFHGWMFTFGVLISFWILAGALFILRSIGQEVGWGFQLQSKLFVMLIAYLLFVLSLNLFGVFEIGGSLIGIGQGVRKQGLWDPLLSGVLATLVATPCTAPFMGVALAFAISQPPFLALVIFTAMAFGLALPYLILCHAPQLLEKLPKPGAWMETFKQAMAFPLLAAVVWLAWVLGQQASSEAIIWLFVGFLFLSLAAWVYGRWTTVAQSDRTRLFALLVSALFLVISLWPTLQIHRLSTPDRVLSDTSIWKPYSPQLIEEFRVQKKPIFIDFTAAWCLTCQVNKRLVLHTSQVENKFREKGVVALLADWTNRDPVITRALQSYGRSGVPAYILYKNDGSYVILPELLTPSIVLDALDRL